MHTSIVRRCILDIKYPLTKKFSLIAINSVNAYYDINKFLVKELISLEIVLSL